MLAAQLLEHQTEGIRITGRHYMAVHTRLNRVGQGANTAGHYPQAGTEGFAGHQAIALRPDRRRDQHILVCIEGSHLRHRHRGAEMHRCAIP